MKKVFLFGFLLILLLAVPFTIYFVSQQTSTKTKANAATTLSLNPESLTVNNGEEANLDVMVNPTVGSGNQITLVKIAITYDATKLTASEGALTIAPLIAPEGKGSAPSEFQFLSGPTYSSGLITATLASPNPSSAIQTSQKIATVKFSTIASTDSTGTQVTFNTTDNQTSASSNNCDITNPSTNCQDQPGENVLQSVKGSSIIINSQQLTPTTTPAPTTGPSGPTCTGIQANPSATESSSIDFTVTGNATPGATISKVTFNFGDGNVQDITDSGGVGTDTINVPASHSYTSGTFTANAILTDSNGATSSSNSCSQIITINGEGNTQAPTPTTISETNTIPTPTMAQSGSQTVIVTSALGITLITIGAVLLFAL